LFLVLKINNVCISLQNYNFIFIQQKQRDKKQLKFRKTMAVSKSLCIFAIEINKLRK